MSKNIYKIEKVRYNGNNEIRNIIFGGYICH